MPWENRRFDVLIPLLVILLMIFGLVVLYSTTVDYGLSFVKKQLIWNIIGLIALFALLFVRERDIKRFPWLLYFLTLILLIAVLRYGVISGGARRWFSLRIGYFQPSEVAKMAVILFTAKLLSVSSRKNLLLSFFAVLAYAGFVAMEPDLGTAVLLVLLWAFMALFSKNSLKAFFTIFAILLILAVVIFFFGLKDYQRQRILAFLDPKSHRQTAAYNVVQSLHTIGSGGLFGRGYLKAPSTKWNYVPKNHTDFIFSAIGEQFGFLGSSLCIIVYMLICLRILRFLKLAKDDFWFLVTIGVLFNLLIHVFINIGMTMGLVPVTGIPLPFVSYGGSSTLSFCLQLGLILKSYAVGKGVLEQEAR
ncbi:rod shape-determining protein RodA [Pseudothermotoga thermarum]|uniref:Cell cycle protein n=1 Tax=Pseudothermotoga thermarum DSM 5069 TaxID=688269 RepID=F7YY74_9THEM|nr:rod shape-determining protein RodA [Pseudothermotoga thermarum]AEH50895.1 cell cycle protein [Pseudothermotoga thermarum DSM 5069]